MRRFLILIIFGISSIHGSILERLPFLRATPLELHAIKQLILPQGASLELYEAAADFQLAWTDRVGRSEGLPIKLRGDEAPKYAIILERREGPWWARFKGSNPTGSFSIKRHGSQVFIRAAEEAGLMNGVYALCHDLLGARWYWAGDLGLEYVGDVPTYYPKRVWRSSPQFVQRQFHPNNNTYSRRNRLVDGYSFNHNLARIFTPEVYASDPEVFASLRGKTKVPKGSLSTDAMPDMTHWRAVEIATEATLAHFIQNPESVSFSLSTNDNSDFDDREQTQQALGELEYFRGRPNYTDYVFHFMNAVAQKVFNEAGAWQTPSGKDRYLTGLAYFWTEQSPSFKLHPRVLPILTSDRAQWHDPLYREEDRALIERWSQSGTERIGTWDYYFGAPYPYPRQFNQWIIESLRHLADNNITIFFSQLPSAWGLDGGKAWLTARLLWDPYQDAEALLDEYYTHFFGAAAEPMRSFYEQAEAHRNANEGRANWIKLYLDEAGIELFPPEVLHKLRDLIDLGHAAVQEDSKYAARLKIVSDAFAFTEHYAAMQSARRLLLESALAGEAKLANKIKDFAAARTAFEVYAEALMKNPMHSRLEYLLKLNQSDPIPFAMTKMSRLGQSLQDLKLEQYQAEKSILANWTMQRRQFVGIFSNTNLAHELGAPQSRDFLGPAIPKLAQWGLGYRASEALQVDPVADRAGLKISGADYFSLQGSFNMGTARDYMIDFELDYKSSPDNRVFLHAVWKDEVGKKVRKDMLIRLPIGSSDGFQEIGIPVRAPEGAVSLMLRLKTERQYAKDYLQIRQFQVHARLKRQ
jgi:hypothetical protein